MPGVNLDNLAEALARFDGAHARAGEALTALGASHGEAYHDARRRYDKASTDDMMAMAAVIGSARAAVEFYRAHKEPWWENRQNIADLLEWLDEHDMMAEDRLSHAVEILEKPWKYDPEYAQMRGNAPPASENTPTLPLLPRVDS